MQYLISFLEGIITFISPCLLPMLPIYITYFAGGGQRTTRKTLSGAMGFVLNFWASWCGPCKSEMPDFDEVWAEYGDRVQFMMVNLTDGSQETKEKAMKYVEEQGYSFPVFYDTDFDAAYTYGVQAVPVTYFVNADGTGAVYFKGAMPKETLLECIGLILPEE